MEKRRAFYQENKGRIKAAKNARYASNVDGYADRSKALTKRRMAENGAIIEAAKSVPCMDCGGRFPTYVMDFDHLADKVFNIAPNRSKAQHLIIAEIAKCEVVCSNCHRIRTHTRKVN